MFEKDIFESVGEYASLLYKYIYQGMCYRKKIEK